MKRIALVLSVVLLSLVAKSQTGFPSTDSLHRYNNRYIRNSAVEAFSNLRLNTLLHGIISWIDTARLEGSGEGGTITLGVDTVYMLNDSVMRYRKNGVNYNIEMPGVYDVRNGLTKYGGVIGFGGTLVEPTLINQSGAQMTFYDGEFVHGWGDYVNQATDFSILDNGQYGFFVTQSDDDGDRVQYQQGVGSDDPFAEITAKSPGFPVGSILRVRHDKLSLYHEDGEVYIPSLIDSSQEKAVFYDPATGKLTYGNAGGGGGGGGSNRFGVAGEDDQASGTRSFDQSGNGITLHDGIFEHIWGDISYVTEYSSIKGGENTITLSQRGTGAIYNSLTLTNAGDGETVGIGMEAHDDNHPGGASIDVRPDYLWLYHADGLIHIEGLIDSAQAYSLYYNPTTHKITYALNGGGSGGGGSAGLSQNAANGISMRNDSTSILGGSLDAQTTIDGGASYTLNVTGSRGSGNATLNVTNSGAGSGIIGTGGQYGVRGSTTSGTGVRGEATSGGIGVSASSDVLPLDVQLNSSLTNALGQVLAQSVLTSGTPASGIGGYLGQYVENSSGTPYLTAKFGSKWTDVTHATRTSMIEFHNTNQALDRRVMAITGPGQVILDKYGIGDFEDIPVYGLGVDADGNVIEYDLSGGSGLSAVSHDGTLTGNGTSGSPLGVNTDVIATTDYVDAHTASGGTTLTSWTNVLSIPGVVANAVQGSTVGSSPTGTSVAAAINSWITNTAVSGATLFFPRSGSGYLLSAPIQYPSNKRLHIVVEGIIYTGTNSAFIMDGYLQTLDTKKGNIIGTNQTAGAPNYGSQTNTGVWVRSCESCRADVGEVMGYKYGVQVGGYATGTATVQGAQFNRITFTYLRRNSVGIYVHPSGGTTNSNGNWANANGFWGGKIVADTGVLFRPDVTQGDRFNGNNFYQVGFENGGSPSIPMKVAVYLTFAVNNSFFGCRFEPTPITKKLVCTSDVDNTNFFGQSYFQWNWLDAPGNNIHISGPIYDGVSGISVGNEADGYRYSSTSTHFNQRVRIKGTTRSPSAMANKPSNIDVEYTNETRANVTGSTYTVADGIELVTVSYSAGTSTVTLPSATLNPDRVIVVKNMSGSTSVAVTGQSTIAASGVAQYRSAGGSWIKIN